MLGLADRGLVDQDGHLTRVSPPGDPLEFLDEGDCSTPEGAGCTGADRSSMPGDWTITMNREFRADEGMWYLAAIYPA